MEVSIAGMSNWKWVKVQAKAEWVCDVCSTCGDDRCCSRPAKWLKHPNVFLTKSDRSLRFPREGHIGDIALCDLCFDNHKDRITEEWLRRNEVDED